MNSWINVSCIVIILSAQVYFGVGPVSGTMLTPQQGNVVYSAVYNLYYDVKTNLANNGIQNIDLGQWTNGIEITIKRDHEEYVTWAKNGATIISNAVREGQGNAFDARIDNAKNTIQQAKLPAGVATDINEVLEKLKNNLNTPQAVGCW